jgi:glutamate dehydrogenase (NAD(P)+)
MDTYSMYQGRTVSETVTGKPVECGGTVGRREATGRGIAYLIDRAMDRRGIRANGATAIVQGFGNVGAVTAARLQMRGVKVIGVSDHTAAYYDPKGLDIAALEAHVRGNRVLAGYSTQSLIDPAEFLVQPCDVLAPCAVERVITGENVGRLQCRILAEGANGPTTPEADEVLDRHPDDIFIIPDILCNAGGVIVSYFEWVQGMQQYFWDGSEVADKLDRAMERSFQKVLQRAQADGVSQRKAALSIGVETVRKAKQWRGLFP